MFVFVCCVHPTSLSVSISLAGICYCSTVWFRNCFRPVFSVYISRFRLLIRFRLHVKFCLFVFTKVILPLNLVTVPLIIIFTYQRKIKDWIYLYISMSTIWMSESVKLLSVNVRGLSNFKKRRAIFTCAENRMQILFFCKKHI